MRTTFVPFSKVPYSDTCWSLIEGPDDRAYAVACCEHSSGQATYIVRYDPKTRQSEYLLDVAAAVGEPPDNGRATQCKIHYSMIIDDDGIMYAATHLSGPAVDQTFYNPWGTFDDPQRSYVGCKLFAYDTIKEKILWTDTLVPWEGCRCLALDRDRRLLYAAAYPRDHVYVYELDSRRLHDLGRLGCVNPQAIWLDRTGRAYTTNDDGRITVIQGGAAGWEMRETDTQTPYAAYQTGWHNVVYDVVQVPGADAVAGGAWNIDPRLFLLEHSAEGAMRMRDLGPAKPGIDGYGDRGFNGDHCGGLCFGATGELLFCVSQSRSGMWPTASAMLKRMNIQTGEVHDVAPLNAECGKVIPYISRTIRLGARHLVMGVVGHVPTGILHVELDDDLSAGPLQQTPRRYWG